MVSRAEALMKKANDMTQVSWLTLRFSPDWDGAAQFYEQAANVYTSIKMFSKARFALKRAAYCFLEMRLANTAARYYERAAMSARDEKETKEAGELLHQAAMCYRENGTPEKAAEVLGRAAKLLENDDPAQACECWMEACDIYETEEKEHFSVETFRGAIGLLVRLEKWQEAVQMIERQIAVFEKIKQPHNVSKMCLCILLIHLHNDDFVAAQRAYDQLLSKIPTFVNSSESKLAGDLLDAYEHNDEDALANCVKKQTFNFLDNTFVRMARGLTVRGGGKVPITQNFESIPKQYVPPSSQPARPGQLVSGNVAELFGAPPLPSSITGKQRAEPKEPKYITIELPTPPATTTPAPAPAPASAPSQPEPFAPYIPPPPSVTSALCDDDFDAEPPRIIPQFAGLGISKPQEEKYSAPAQIAVPKGLTESSLRGEPDVPSFGATLTELPSNIPTSTFQPFEEEEGSLC